MALCFYCNIFSLLWKENFQKVLGVFGIKNVVFFPPNECFFTVFWMNKKDMVAPGVKTKKACLFMSNCCQHNIPLFYYVCLQMIGKKDAHTTFVHVCMCFFFDLVTFNLKLFSQIHNSIFFSEYFTVPYFTHSNIIQHHETKRFSCLWPGLPDDHVQRDCWWTWSCNRYLDMSRKTVMFVFSSTRLPVILNKSTDR